MRRPHALHAPSLLIDEDRRIAPAERLPNRAAESTDIVQLADVAPEQDDAPGPGVAQKGALLLG